MFHAAVRSVSVRSQNLVFSNSRCSHLLPFIHYYSGAASFSSTSFVSPSPRSRPETACDITPAPFVAFSLPEPGKLMIVCSVQHRPCLTAGGHHGPLGGPTSCGSITTKSWIWASRVLYGNPSHSAQGSTLLNERPCAPGHLLTWRLAPTQLTVAQGDPSMGCKGRSW